MSKSYSELIQIPDFEDRFRYLMLRGFVGRATFGFDRYINQQFYTSREWRQTRHFVIARDLGCDLAVEGYEIHSKVIIHHMNPIEADDIIQHYDHILEPEFLITTTLRTHNAIHFGDERQLLKPFVDRRRGDTRLW